MDARRIGVVTSGLTAPMPAASVRLLGATSVAADTVSPAGLNPQKESAPAAQATQSREQNERSNSATGPGADKAFHTLRAELALCGYGLSRTRAGDGPVYFHLNRWGMVRELRDIEAVRALAQQVGARNA